MAPKTSGKGGRKTAATAAKPAGNAKPAAKSTSKKPAAQPTRVAKPKAAKPKVAKTEAVKPRAAKPKAAKPKVASTRPTTRSTQKAVNTQSASSSPEAFERPTLAEASHAVEFTFDDTNARLTVTITVKTDPNDANSSRTSYTAEFFLTPDIESEGPAEKVGELTSFLIGKTIFAAGDRKVPLWRKQLLVARYDDLHAGLKETSLALRGLYIQSGAIRAALREKDFAQHLTDDTLVFLDTIEIFPKHARKGLLRHALTGYYSALAALTAPHAYTGTIILIPARPQGVKGEAWDEMDDDDVATTLIALYTRYGYAHWVTKFKLLKIQTLQWMTFRATPPATIQATGATG